MFIKILFFLAKIAPFRVFQAFGSFLGFLMVFSNSKSLKTSSTNLKHVFKSKTKEEIDYALQCIEKVVVGALVKS